MDYTYFKNASGSYAAKRLPTPKNARIKIKDVSDLDELKEELREEKPNTEQDFKTIYDYIFDEEYCYEVDVESFEKAMCANRQKLLSSDTWIKKYWHDLHTFIGDFDVGEPEINEEPQVVEDDFANTLRKAGVVKQVPLIEYENWEIALNYEKLPEIKERCKAIGIKLTKKNKGALIHELIKYEEEHPNTLVQPKLIKALPIFEEKIKSLYVLYLNEIESALNEFDYPKPFKIAVWEEATVNAEGELQALLQQKLNTLVPPKTRTIVEEKSLNRQEPAKPNLSTISESVSQNREPQVTIKFSYENAMAEKSTRQVDIYEFENDDLSFTGFCHKAGDERTFNLSRVSGLIKYINGDDEQVITKNALIKNLQSNFSSTSKTKSINEPIKNNATGCFVVSVALFSTLLALPIGLVTIFI
ncbi:WYL domain-containing protein [Pseudoalteromonas shioyasakiensis]|nr:WYL domain-containing protein [Pseudoalteromonas shioyasakiensis]